MSDYQEHGLIPNISHKSYTVGIGDTLALVAARHDTTVSELFIINNLTSSFIHPGQQLLVPSKPNQVDVEESDDTNSKSSSTDKTRKLSSGDLPIKTTIRATGRASVPHVVVQPNFGPDPMTVTCFNCRNVVTTRVTESANALCCFMFGLWSLCCPGCQDVEHRCPRCNVILGNYKAA